MGAGRRVVVTVIAAVAVMLSSCGDATETTDAAPGADADEPTGLIDVGPTPEATAVLTPVVGVGGSMLAIGGAPDQSVRRHGVVRSDGPGQPWEWVDLPDAPERSSTALVHWSLTTRGTRALATATITEGSTTVWAWTSPDGSAWTGGRVGTFDGYSVGVADIPDGMPTLVVQRGRGMVVVHSADGAASWQEVPVDGVALAEDEGASLRGNLWSVPDGGVRGLIGYHGQTPRRDQTLIGAPSPAGPWSVLEPSCDPWAEPRGVCHPTLEAGGVLARGLEVSHDGGATWTLAEFDVPLLADDVYAEVHGFRSLAALPGGGLVGTISGFIPAGGGPLAWVVRSDDGRAWSTLLGPGIDGCSERPIDTDQPWASAELPVVTGDEVHVAFNCPGFDAGLFRIDGADGAVEVLHRLTTDRRVGRPFDHDGAIVAPVEGLDTSLVHGFIVAR